MFERHRYAPGTESEPSTPQYVAVLIILGVFVVMVFSLVGIVSV
jgi:hypothetical protein